MIVRPYTLTGGRTEPTNSNLPLETLVATTPAGAAARRLLEREAEAILELCHRVVSVAEVAARLHLPLGVARVLVADLADSGYVQLHRPAHVGDRPDSALLRRVLHGLRSA
jgi:hypothetical protein